MENQLQITLNNVTEFYTNIAHISEYQIKRFEEIQNILTYLEKGVVDTVVSLQNSQVCKVYMYIHICIYSDN